MQYLVLTALYRIVEADFKSVRKKFIDQGEDPEIVKDYLAKFKTLKNADKIKDLQDKNIDTWGKREFKDFQAFVDNFKATKQKTLKPMEGAELRTENDDWLVYKITTEEASCFYGAGTNWCVAKKNSPHWDQYYRKNDFYYYISKTRDKDDEYHKIARVVNQHGKSKWFDAPDKEFSMSGDLELNLPPVELDQVVVAPPGEWQQKALDELIAELEMDAEEVEITNEYGSYISVEGSGANNGESEWTIYEDSEAAERAAVQYMQTLIDDGDFGNNEFLKRFLTVSESTAEQIGQEEADSLYADMDEDEIFNDADGFGIEYGDVEKARSGLIELRYEELDDDLDDAALKKAKEEIDSDYKIKRKDNLFEEADDEDIDYKDVELARRELTEARMESISKQIKDDILGYFEDLYGEGEDAEKAAFEFGNLDTLAAAQAVVDSDGLGNTLDRYDGAEIELPSGALAFGQN